jgi:hypothetical protein
MGTHIFLETLMAPMCLSFLSVAELNKYDLIQHGIVSLSMPFRF